MARQALIVGGGMGGLAAAIACTRAGWETRLYEQAEQFSEVGAGIQLGPNATRLLSGWGLGRALDSVAAFPRRLNVRSGSDDTLLGSLELGPAIQDRYGAPYVTLHRCDLQWMLLEAARKAGVHFTMPAHAASVSQSADAVSLHFDGGPAPEGDALVGADGLWSAVRSHVVADGAPRATGHLAYRGLVAQKDLPSGQRTNDVNVWLAPRMHLVAYPVRGGQDLNVVAVIEGNSRGPAQDWDQEALAVELQHTMVDLCGPMRALVQAMPAWRLWALHDRPPMRSADEMARGRIALVGDAAHPMRPYFAQGAGMALEDAAELGRCLSMVQGAAIDVPLALRRYALNRWQRDAKVQGLSRRNGRIFHARGLMRVGRDWSMKLLGERLLDQPWLYGA